MKADAYPLSTVFGTERQLFAPLFQRKYVWQKDLQWEPLWTDLLKLTEAALAQEPVRPYFMGAVVLEQMRVTIGKPDGRSIIDGQQRLTTLQLLLAAFRDYCAAFYPESKLQHSIDGLICNDKNMYEDRQDQFKLWPTNIDRRPYEVALTSGGLAGMQNQAREEGLSSFILDAYAYFYKALQSWVPEGTEGGAQMLRTLFDIIRQYVRLVVIDMDQEDDAQVIFETLNARGTPLLPSDLVKNYLFYKAQGEGEDIDELYQTYWAPFDQESAFWHKEIRQGRFFRPALDLFLQHYLTLQRFRDVSATSLFAEYKGFAVASGWSAKTLLASFQAHAKHFKHFLTADRQTPEGDFFHKLKDMDTTTVYPFLLGLYQETGNGEEAQQAREEVLRMLESFLVRRMVCRLTTKNYNRLFLDLLNHLRESGNYSPDSVRSFFLGKKRDTGRWPDDEEFRSAWLREPLYNVIKRDRLRLILKDLDSGLHEPKTESYYLRDGLTVEHLLPQHWQEHWPLSSDGQELSVEETQERKERRQALLHTIGNLTFLTKNLNPAVSNGPFQTKREQILEHSAINLNRFLYNLSHWNEDRIEERGARLFEAARRIWQHPEGDGQGVVG